MADSNHNTTQSNNTHSNQNPNQAQLPRVTSRTATKPDTPGGVPPIPAPQTPSWKVPSVAYGFGGRGICFFGGLSWVMCGVGVFAYYVGCFFKFLKGGG